MNDEEKSETRCVGGRPHVHLVDATDPEFDERWLVATEIPADWHDQMYGYCAACKTAMRWDAEQQQIIDWPEGNTVPHCTHCGTAIALGQHYLGNVRIELETFHGPYDELLRVRDLEFGPAFEGPLCSPLCLMYETVDNVFLKDVFGR